MVCRKAIARISAVRVVHCRRNEVDTLLGLLAGALFDVLQLDRRRHHLVIAYKSDADLITDLIGF